MTLYQKWVALCLHCASVCPFSVGALSLGSWIGWLAALDRIREPRSRMAEGVVLGMSLKTTLAGMGLEAGYIILK